MPGKEGGFRPGSCGLMKIEEWGSDIAFQAVKGTAGARS